MLAPHAAGAPNPGAAAVKEFELFVGVNLWPLSRPAAGIYGVAMNAVGRKLSATLPGGWRCLARRAIRAGDGSQVPPPSEAAQSGESCEHQERCGCPHGWADFLKERWYTEAEVSHKIEESGERSAMFGWPPDGEVEESGS